MFLYDFFNCNKTEILILKLEIQNKGKKLFLILPGAKRTPYDPHLQARSKRPCK